MEICKNKVFNYSLVVLGLSLLIIGLSVLQSKKIISEKDKEVVEDVLKDMVVVELAYKDGNYEVDRAKKTFYIDVT